jgi:hypothetical protein
VREKCTTIHLGMAWMIETDDEQASGQLHRSWRQGKLPDHLHQQNDVCHSLPPPLRQMLTIITLPTYMYSVSRRNCIEPGNLLARDWLDGAQCVRSRCPLLHHTQHCPLTSKGRDAPIPAHRTRILIFVATWCVLLVRCAAPRNPCQAPSHY